MDINIMVLFYCLVDDVDFWSDEVILDLYMYYDWFCDCGFVVWLSCYDVWVIIYYLVVCDVLLLFDVFLLVSGCMMNVVMVNVIMLCIDDLDYLVLC